MSSVPIRAGGSGSYGAVKTTFAEDSLLIQNVKEQHENNEQNSSCRQQAITVFGWAFDFVTVAISLIDVVSDILVALQFLHDGHTVWAWLVFGCFINSNCIYSAMITELCFKDEYNEHGYFQYIPICLRRLPRPLLFIMVFPFAQLSPTVNYIMQTFVIDTSERDEYQHTTTTSLADEAAEVAKEEHRAVKGSVETMGRLLDALKKQFHTHGMLFTETVVESIPQSIIQLLAITFLGSPSDLQVFSMSLSLLSVVSKGYFASVSCDLRIFFVKFLMISHDVFSMFYLFCSIVSKEGPKDYALFGVVDVSWISLVWFIKVFAVAGTGALFLIFFGLLLLFGKSCFQNDVPTLDASDIRKIFVLIFGAILGFIPGLLALESMKLSWLIVWLHRHEPSPSQLPLAAMLFSFLQGKTTTASGGNNDDLVEGSTNPEALLKLLKGKDGHLFRQNDWHERLAYLYMKEYGVMLTYGVEGYTCIFALEEKSYFDRTTRLQLTAEGCLKRAMLEARRNRPTSMTAPMPTGILRYPSDSWLDEVVDDTDDDRQLYQRDPLLSDDVRKRIEGQWFYNATTFEDATYTRDKLLALDGNVMEAIAEKHREIDAIEELLQSEKHELLHNFAVNKLFDHKRLRKIYLSKRSFWFGTEIIREHSPYTNKLRDLGQQLFAIFLFINGTCTFVSLFYPYINYPLHFHTQNLLQHVCFGLMVASLVLMLPLLPTCRKYISFLFEGNVIIRFLTSGHYTMSRLEPLEGLSQYIAGFHLPPVTHALRDAIPGDILPTDVVSVVGQLLPQGTVELRHLSIAECRRMKFI